MTKTGDPEDGSDEVLTTTIDDGGKEGTAPPKAEPAAKKDGDADEVVVEAGDRGDNFEGTTDVLETASPETLEKIAGEEKKGDGTPADKGDGKPPVKPEPSEADKRIKVPKYRLDEEIKKKEELARENARLLAEREALLAAGKAPEKAPETAVSTEKPAEKPAPAAYDFDAAEQKYMDAVVDGDKELAISIRKEIRAAEKAQFEAEQAAKQAEVQKIGTVQSQMQEVAEKAYEHYPFLNNKAKEANPQAIEMLIAVRDQHYRKGVPLVDALQKAIDQVGPLFAEDVDGAEADKDLTEEQKRVKAASQAAAKVTQGQPPITTGAGTKQMGRVNVTTLSEDDFDKLPESEKKRLRGD